jgi:hypothetical protein
MEAGQGPADPRGDVDGAGRGALGIHGALAVRWRQACEGPEKRGNLGRW